MAHAKALEMSDEDRSTLNEISRKRTIEMRVGIRARILLYKADGWASQQIADTFKVNINTVNLCVAKYKEGGIERALYDDARSGRRPRITDEDKAWVISVACAGPREMGLPQDVWSYSALTTFIRSHATAAGHPALEKVSKTKVFNILDGSEIKPHRIRYYCEKRDPEFDAKMHDVLVVYKQVEMQFDDKGNVIIPDEGPMVHTVSCDEKPGIQVLEAFGELQPDAEHGYVGRDYEYKRHGTISLLAGIDLLTGMITPVISDTHSSTDFINLLQHLDKQYPEGDVIRILCDNHTTHTSKEVNAFLDTRPERFKFVFTPKHASWLNLIETVFSRLTKQMLRGARAKTKEELTKRIYDYFDACNKEPVVFHWYYKMDEIPEDEALGKLSENGSDSKITCEEETPTKMDEDKPAKKSRGKKQKATEETPKKVSLKRGKKDPAKTKEIKMAAADSVTHSTIKSRRTRQAQKAKCTNPSAGKNSTT